MVMLPGFGARDENLDVGVNILFDTARQQPFRPPRATPQAHDAPLVASRAARSPTSAASSRRFPDGHCKVARVCNCVEEKLRIAAARGEPAAVAAAAAKCTARCGEGGRDVVVKPTQWQTACSACSAA